MSNELIITADDYGMSHEINDGIHLCIKNNLINSISICTNYKKTVYISPSLLTDLAYTGLHINLSDGFSLSKSKQLEIGGKLKSPIELLNENISEDIFLNEISSQLRKFEKLICKPPQYLDGHQYLVYLIPNAFSAMLKIAKEYNIPIRSPNNFIEAMNLFKFKKRILSSHRIILPIDCSKRASELLNIYKHHKVQIRSEFLLFDVPSTLGEIVKSIEIVSHPVIDKNGIINNDITSLINLLRNQHVAISCKIGVQNWGQV